MSNETVEYKRRYSGVKKTLVKADTWAVNVADFTADDICPAKAGSDEVSIALAPACFI